MEAQPPTQTTSQTTAQTTTPTHPLTSETSLLISALIVLSVVTFVAETFPLAALWQAEFRAIDGAIALVFALEYGARLWQAEHRLAAVFNPLSLIDAVVVLELVASLLGVPVMQAGRGVRLLRLLRFFEVNIGLLHLDSRDRVILARVVFTLTAIVTIFAGLIYEVEHSVNSEVFGTALDAIYFAIVTMTTVGFGDMTPVTSTGRLLTIVMILTGVALIPWQLGQFIEQLVKSGQRKVIVCSRCGRDHHDHDAHFCCQCGAALELDDV